MARLITLYQAVRLWVQSLILPDCQAAISCTLHVPIMLRCPHSSMVHCFNASIVWITQHPKKKSATEPHSCASERKSQTNLFNRSACMTCATWSWGPPGALKGGTHAPSCWPSRGAAPWQSGCASCMQWEQHCKPHTGPVSQVSSLSMPVL